MNPSTIVRDVRYAGRMLLRNPGFSVVALLTFAIGIGVNTAVFSVFNGVLLRPLPYADADRITMMWLDNRPQAIKEDIGLVLILRQHPRPAIIGVVLALAGALALAQFLQSMVYGVRTTDPVTFVAMGLTLLLVAVGASWIPARRATRIDALVALRNQ